MKIVPLSFATAVLGLMLGGSQPGKTETIYPWCLRVVAQDYSVDRCEYKTLDACNRERANEGAKSYCIVNPVSYFRQPGKAKGS